MAVVAADVKTIYPTTLADGSITPLITLATNFVTTLLLGKGLSDATTDGIISYVTAHMLVLSYEGGGLSRQRLGDSDESFKTPGDFDLGLKSTRFGQMAMILDTTGTLAAASANNGLKALFEVV